MEPSPVVAALEEQRYRLVILRAPDTRMCQERWGRAMLDVVARRYRPLLRAGDLVVYDPADDDASPSAPLSGSPPPSARTREQEKALRRRSK